MVAIAFAATGMLIAFIGIASLVYAGVQENRAKKDHFTNLGIGLVICGLVVAAMIGMASGIENSDERMYELTQTAEANK